MKRAALALLTATAAVTVVGPLVVVLLIVGVTAAPAATTGQRVPPGALECPPDTSGTTVTTGGGGWRVPFAQPYAVSDRGFGPRPHPVYGGTRMHTGQDLIAQPGPGPVLAAADGTVTRAGPLGGYGTTVVLDHNPNDPRNIDDPRRGRSAGISTLYAHLARIAPGITAGVRVRAGQVLGVEGSTGTSTGNHLHFEVRLGNRPVDPRAFMAAHGAPLTGHQPPTHDSSASRTTDNRPAPKTSPSPPAGEGPARRWPGSEFALPAPHGPRRASLQTPAAPIPPAVKALYVAAARRYGIPWTLLAGIGMAETRHGLAKGVSSAGARGLMQFMPATFAAYGVDADGGGPNMDSDGDSIHSAAAYLVASGARRGPDGVRTALYAYNHAQWYVNDVLTYAHAYGGGTLTPLTTPLECTPPGEAAVPPAAPAPDPNPRPRLSQATTPTPATPAAPAPPGARTAPTNGEARRDRSRK